MIVHMCDMPWLYFCVDLGATTIWFLPFQIGSIIFYSFAILNLYQFVLVNVWVCNFGDIFCHGKNIIQHLPITISPKLYMAFCWLCQLFTTSHYFASTTNYLTQSKLEQLWKFLIFYEEFVVLTQNHNLI